MNADISGYTDWFGPYYGRPDDASLSILIYLVIALCIGVAQWVALRKVLPRAWLWIATTVIGTALGAALSIWLDEEGTWLVGLAWIALPVAILQGLVLRPELGRTWLWWFLKPFLMLPSVFLGALVAIMGMFLFVFLMAGLEPLGLGFLGDILGPAIMITPTGLIFGLLTGILLGYLLQRAHEQDAVLDPEYPNSQVSPDT